MRLYTTEQRSRCKLPGLTKHFIDACCLSHNPFFNTKQITKQLTARLGPSIHLRNSQQRRYEHDTGNANDWQICAWAEIDAPIFNLSL